MFHVAVAYPDHQGYFAQHRMNGTPKEIRSHI
jgi:hypothetical protein